MADNVNRLLDYDMVAGTALYLARPETIGSDDHVGSELVLADLVTGNTNSIAQGVLTASLAPAGARPTLPRDRA